MRPIKIAQEWDFIVNETHREQPDKKTALKRELLFALQILLGQIESAVKSGQANFFSNNYFLVKEKYLSL